MGLEPWGLASPGRPALGLGQAPLVMAGSGAGQRCPRCPLRFSAPLEAPQGPYLLAGDGEVLGALCPHAPHRCSVLLNIFLMVPLCPHLLSDPQ